MHYCRWGGLNVRLPFPIPDLPIHEDPHRAPDVTVSMGRIPAEWSGLRQVDERQFVAPDAYLFCRAGIARYWVERGERILIEPEPGASTDSLGAYLLGRPFAALAYQRGWLSIHGGTIVTDAGAFVFAAPAGTGKSTLLAALDDAGHALLSDDAALVRLDAGGCTVWPTSQRFRLFPDSAARFGVERKFEPVREDFDKGAAFFARPVTTPTPLAGIFLLRRQGDAPGVGRLPLARAVAGLVENLNRPFLAELIRGMPNLVHDVAALVSKTPVHTLTIADDLSRLDEAVALLEQHGIRPRRLASVRI